MALFSARFYKKINYRYEINWDSVNKITAGPVLRGFKTMPQNPGNSLSAGLFHAYLSNITFQTGKNKPQSWKWLV